VAGVSTAIVLGLREREGGGGGGEKLGKSLPSVDTGDRWVWVVDDLDDAMAVFQTFNLKLSDVQQRKSDFKELEWPVTYLPVTAQFSSFISTTRT